MALSNIKYNPTFGEGVEILEKKVKIKCVDRIKVGVKIGRRVKDRYKKGKRRPPFIL